MNPLPAGDPGIAVVMPPFSHTFSFSRKLKNQKTKQINGQP